MSPWCVREIWSTGRKKLQETHLVMLDSRIQMSNALCDVTQF